MDYTKLKNYRLWIAVIGALLGVALSQGVLIEGSTAAQVVGWILSVLGIGGAGAVVAAPKTADLPTATEDSI